MNKVIVVVVNLLFLLAILYFVLINIENISVFNFAKSATGVEINTSVLIVILYILGFGVGIMQHFFIKETYKNQIEFYARKNEKLSQQSEFDTDKKEVLERKIATLEIALKNALKSKE